MAIKAVAAEISKKPSTESSTKKKKVSAAHTWTAHPDPWYTLLENNCLSGWQEGKLVSLVLRFTVGQEDKRRFTRGVTVAEFAERSGNVSAEDNKNIVRCFARMVAVGILERRQDNKDSRVWNYRAAVENWQTVEAYVPPIVKKKQEPSEPAVPIAVENRPMVLPPGGKTKIRELPNVSKSEWSWINASSSRLQLDGSVIDGRLILTTLDAVGVGAKKERKSDENKGTWKTPISTKSAPIEGISKKTAKKQDPPQTTVLAARFADLRAAIDTVLLDCNCSVIEDNTLSQVEERLRGAPFELLISIAEKSRKRIKRPSIFLNFADDAARTHAAGQARERLAQPNPSDRPTQAVGSEKWRRTQRAMLPYYDASQRAELKELDPEGFGDL